VAGVPVKGLPQVVRPAGRHLFTGLLGPVAGAGEIAVQQAGGELVGRDGGRRAGADPVLLAARMVGREDHAPGGDLRLIDRGHGLGVIGQPGQGPSEENSGSLVDERQGYDAAATKRIKLPKRAPTARS